MERLVHCKKMGKELPGLDYQPLKGELGLKVFENISKEAWKMKQLRSFKLVGNVLKTFEYKRTKNTF